MHFYRKCWFDPIEEQFMSPFLSDCPSLMLGIAIHCIQHFQAMLECGVCELAQSFFHIACSQSSSPGSVKIWKGYPKRTKKPWRVWDGRGCTPPTWWTGPPWTGRIRDPVQYRAGVSESGRALSRWGLLRGTWAFLHICSSMAMWAFALLQGPQVITYLWLLLIVKMMLSAWLAMPLTRNKCSTKQGKGNHPNKNTV